MSANFDNLVNFLFKSEIDQSIKFKLQKIHAILNDSEPIKPPGPAGPIDPVPEPNSKLAKPAKPAKPAEPAEPAPASNRPKSVGILGDPHPLDKA